MSLLKKENQHRLGGLPLSASAASMVLIATSIVLQPRWSVVASTRSTPVVVTIVVVVPVSTASTSIATEIASVVVVEIALMSGRSSIASIVAAVVHPCWRRRGSIPEVIVKVTIVHVLLHWWGRSTCGEVIVEHVGVRWHIWRNHRWHVGRNVHLAHHVGIAIWWSDIRWWYSGRNSTWGKHARKRTSARSWNVPAARVSEWWEIVSRTWEKWRIESSRFVRWSRLWLWPWHASEIVNGIWIAGDIIHGNVSRFGDGVNLDVWLSWRVRNHMAIEV